MKEISMEKRNIVFNIPHSSINGVFDPQYGGCHITNILSTIILTDGLTGLQIFYSQCCQKRKM